jgi:quercetin dioxygenase-like cupin family protein
MKKNSVMLVLFASFALMASGQDDGHHSLTNNHPTETSISAQHGSPHAGPAGFKPEFENESVQVVRITIGPHEKLPMHDLTPRVVVLLTDQNLRVTLPNGETTEVHHKAGETMWVSGQRHAGENLSDKPIEFIAVIPKEK